MQHNSFIKRRGTGANMHDPRPGMPGKAPLGGSTGIRGKGGFRGGYAGSFNPTNPSGIGKSGYSAEARPEGNKGGFDYHAPAHARGHQGGGEGSYNPGNPENGPSGYSREARPGTNQGGFYEEGAGSMGANPARRSTGEHPTSHVGRMKIDTPMNPGVKNPQRMRTSQAPAVGHDATKRRGRNAFAKRLFSDERTDIER